MKVTICISSYNGAKYIKETLRSVLNQSYKDIEILVTDDASTDNTFSVLLSLKDPRLQIYQNQKNQGLPKNVNKMINTATGEFCILLGQDDLLEPDHIEKMLAMFSDPSIGLVHCNAQYIDENGNPLNIMARDIKTQIQKNNAPLKALAFDNYIQSCGMMFRTNFFRKCGGWDERYHLFGEWLFYIKMAQICSFNFCQNVCPFYRKHSASTIHTINKEKIFSVFLYHTKCRFMAFKTTSLNAKEILFFYKNITYSFLKVIKKMI